MKMVYWLVLLLAGALAFAANNSTLTGSFTGHHRMLNTGCNTHFEYDFSDFLVSKTNVKSVLFDSHIFVLSTRNNKSARLHKFGLDGSSVDHRWFTEILGEHDARSLSVTSNGKIIVKVYTLYFGGHYEVVLLVNAQTMLTEGSAFYTSTTSLSSLTYSDLFSVDK